MAAERRSGAALAALLLIALPALAAEIAPGVRRVCVPAEDGRTWECGTADDPPPQRALAPRDSPPPPSLLAAPDAPMIVPIEDAPAANAEPIRPRTDDFPAAPSRDANAVVADDARGADGDSAVATSEAPPDPGATPEIVGAADAAPEVAAEVDATDDPVAEAAVAEAPASGGEPPSEPPAFLAAPPRRGLSPGPPVRTAPIAEQVEPEPAPAAKPPAEAEVAADAAIGSPPKVARDPAADAEPEPVAQGAPEPVAGDPEPAPRVEAPGEPAEPVAETAPPPEPAAEPVAETAAPPERAAEAVAETIAPAEPATGAVAETAAPPEPAAEPDAEMPAPPEPAPSADIAPRGQDDFLALPGAAYTVQLAHARDASGFPALLATLGLDGSDAYAVPFDRDGARWWMMTWSSFPDAASARAALARLPRGEGINVGYPRRIALIQNELRK